MNIVLPGMRPEPTSGNQKGSKIYMINTHKVKQVYKQGFARTINQLSEPRLQSILKITAKLPRLPLKTLLDIGCGDGIFTKQLAKIAGVNHIDGIDISQKAAAIAQKNGIDVRVIDVDETDFPYHSSSFDLIYCGNLIELVADADHLLQEIFRVLKKDGYLIMSFPNICAWGSRIAICLGYMPFYSRVSTHYDLGKLASRTTKGESTGFIRLFSLDAFKKITSLYHYKISGIWGTPANCLPKYLTVIDRFLAYFPSLACQIVAVIQKKI